MDKEEKIEYVSIVNYTTSEFIKRFGGKENIIGEKIRKTTNYFKLDSKLLHSDPYNNSSTYEIPFEVVELLNCMIKAYEISLTRVERFPCKKGEFKIDIINNNNKEIIGEIEKLPDYIKYLVKRSSSYKYNYKLKDLSKIFSEKLATIFSIIFSKSNVEAGNVVEDIVKGIDLWIFLYFDNYIGIQYANKNNIPILNYDENKNFNCKNNSEYAIEYSLKNAFNVILEARDVLFNRGRNNIKLKSDKNQFSLDELSNLKNSVNTDCYKKDKEFDGEKLKRVFKNIKSKNNEKLNNKINDIINKIDNKEIQSKESLYRNIALVDKEHLNEYTIEDRQIARKIYGKFLSYTFRNYKELYEIEKPKNKIDLNNLKSSYIEYDEILFKIRVILTNLFLEYTDKRCAYLVQNSQKFIEGKKISIKYENIENQDNILMYIVYQENIFNKLIEEIEKLYSKRIENSILNRKIEEILLKYSKIIREKLKNEEKDFIEKSKLEGNYNNIHRLIKDLIGEMTYERIKNEYKKEQIESISEFKNK